MAVTASKVRELREMTGAGMMDCKKALEASSGDMEAAVDQLRKQGLSRAAKKAERETGEGRVFAAVTDDGSRGTLVGIACETDFLAGSDKFTAFVEELRTQVLDQDPDGVDSGKRPILELRWPQTDSSIGEAVKLTIGEMGENIQVTGVERIESAGGRLGYYIHHDQKQAAMVAVTGIANDGQAADTLKALCQHIVVFTPAFRTREEVPSADVEREKQVLRDQPDVASKPAEVQEKMLVGRLNKFYSERVLMDQAWVHDDKQSVSKALKAALGKDAEVAAYARVKIGG